MNKTPKISLKIIRSYNNKYYVQINGKTAKTPEGNLMELPTSKLAQIILKNYKSYKTKRNNTIVSPIRLANTAIDMVAKDKNNYIKQLCSYANSDLVCYFASSPEDLVKKQNKSWLPLITFMQDFYNINILYTTEIFSINQTKESLSKLKVILNKKNNFELSAISVLSQLTSSIIISLALVNDKINVKNTFELSNLEEIYQSTFWGKDEEAFTRLKAISVDIKNVKKYYDALKD